MQNEKTSPAAASAAARTLRDPNASTDAKSAAGSALTQAPDRGPIMSTERGRLVYRLQIDGSDDELWLASGMAHAVEQSWQRYRHEDLADREQLTDRSLDEAALREEREVYERDITSCTLIGELTDTQRTRRFWLGRYMGPAPAEVFVELVMPAETEEADVFATERGFVADVGIRVPAK
jgi:hypothetical protein